MIRAIVAILMIMGLFMPLVQFKTEIGHLCSWPGGDEFECGKHENRYYTAVMWHYQYEWHEKFGGRWLFNFPNVNTYWAWTIYDFSEPFWNFIVQITPYIEVSNYDGYYESKGYGLVIELYRPMIYYKDRYWSEEMIMNWSSAKGWNFEYEENK